MALSKKATPNGKKQMQNYGATARHFATSLAIKKGRPITVGDTVRRKSDGKVFTVSEVTNYCIRLKESSGDFNIPGFEIVSPQKHR